ncbi:MAG TPA: recombinase family protein [Steroidobacter sp.]|uniref:recombinase family protein n=1 Tax=Steroidobacter sp. TaxID=1978227 RepID=UPI002EDA2D48
MAIIGYARISTSEQHLDLQRDALRAAGCARIYEDLGVSAIAKRRPGFEGALAALRSGDTFVIWKMDRAFRSLRQALETMERFQRDSIAFRSLTEHIDTSTPMGQAMFQIQNVFAELERKLISERTKAGLEAARRRGKHPGRRCKLSRCDIAWAHEALQCPEQTKAGIARALRVSPRTLRRSLVRPSPKAPPGS